MILAINLYTVKSELLLSRNTPLTSFYISSIKRLGYIGLYIEDSLSKDLIINSIISDNLKIRTVEAVKNVFISSKGTKTRIDYNHLEETKHLVENIVEEILYNKNAIVNLIDLKTFDDYTFHHSVNVTVLSIIIGVALHLNKKDLYKLGLTALLHDIGKIFIEKEILDKNNKLTEKEYNEIKKHSLLGYEYLKMMFEIPTTVDVGVLEHHEKYNGLGYPNQKKGEDICLFARIISLADVYDALTSDRPYRSAMLPSEGMEYIMGGSGSIFDPKLVKIFSRKIAAYPIGTCIKLSDGKSGIVVENYEDFSTRPKIRLLDSPNNEPVYMNLKDDTNTMDITIVEILKM
jgi:HD-GYP domain-containing protein (c-di-GMP phosphodiesterase class II)